MIRTITQEHITIIYEESPEPAIIVASGGIVISYHISELKDLIPHEDPTSDVGMLKAACEAMAVASRVSAKDAIELLMAFYRKERESQ